MIIIIMSMIPNQNVNAYLLSLIQSHLTLDKQLLFFNTCITKSCHKLVRSVPNDGSQIFHRYSPTLNFGLSR